MAGADHLFVIVLFLSAVLGYVRGFIRESIALLTWLVALWAAWHFADVVYPLLGGALAQPPVNEWFGRAVVLLIVLLAGAAVGGITAYFMQRAVGLALMDRMLGALFGLMRGTVIIGLLVIGGRAVDLQFEPWWERSRLMPVAEVVANWLERYAQPAAAELVDRAKEEPGS